MSSAAGAELAVRVLVRRRNNAVIDTDAIGKVPVRQRTRISAGDFEKQFGANPSDLAAVEQFVAGVSSLKVTASNTISRTVDVTGPVDDVADVFGVDLEYVKIDKAWYHVPRKPVTIPRPLQGIVLAIAGFDNRPGWRRARGAGPKVPHPTARELRDLYQVPGDATGANQRIAIISMDGGWLAPGLAAYEQSLSDDLTAYLKKLYPAGAAPNTPKVTAISGDETQPLAPASDETSLDVQIAASAAPGAEIVVYVANANDVGMAQAISSAVTDAINGPNGPTVISISHCEFEQDVPAGKKGAVAKGIDPQVLSQIEDSFANAVATKTVTVCAASGDWGSAGDTPSPDGRAHALYPASSVNVLACGGTTLVVDAAGERVSEVAWRKTGKKPMVTGGGMSELFRPSPTWQPAGLVEPSVNAGDPAGRAIPDVAAHVGPFVTYVAGVPGQDGGTSASTPFWAGVIACMNEAIGTNCGYITERLYLLYKSGGLAGAFNDITVTPPVDNSYAKVPGYAVRVGWDGCTGFGSPVVEALLAVL